MKKIITLLSLLTLLSGIPVDAAYCSPDTSCAREQPCYIDPCNPCAPVCGLNCGLSVCAIAATIAAVVGVAALIVWSPGSSTAHTH